MRIEPPPSLACAIGTMPAATAAAAPPDDPPEERAGSHGLRVGPNASGSVVGRKPYSGVADLPRKTKPARSQRRACGSGVLAGGALSRWAAPLRVGRPGQSTRSLIRVGTPPNGPLSGPIAAS